MMVNRASSDIESCSYLRGIAPVESKDVSISKQPFFKGWTNAHASAEVASFNDGNTYDNSGIRVMFQDLSYSVPSRHGPMCEASRVHLLQKVSGFFEPQEMTALMGPSGSGKTTLLDVLAGRKTAGTKTGLVSFNGETPSHYFLKRYTGYVEQFDTLISVLTVYEMLIYTAELKRPRSEPFEVKQKGVNALIDRLALRNCKDVRIGDPLRKGISGGQAKRTNIGIALITNPKVLFLDEPTSGLDSRTANEVMKVVKSFVNDITICATIHSPTAMAFQLFDRVMFLSRGHVVYFGVHGQTAVQYARKHWLLPPDVEVYHEAEFLVDAVTEADLAGKAEELAHAYRHSQLKVENDARLRQCLVQSEELPEDIRAQLAVKSGTSTYWFHAVWLLLKYRTRRNYADADWLAARLGDKIILSMLILTLYLGQGNNFNDSNLVNLNSVLFMWIVLPSFGAAQYVPSIVLDRALFMRERSDGLYHVYTYLTFKLIEECAIAALLTLVVCLAVFYAVKFTGEFIVFWLVYYVTLTCGIALAYLIAAISPTMDIANAALPAILTILLFLAGQLQTFDTMPAYYSWATYLNFMKYAYASLMVNQFEEHNVILSGNQTVLQYYSLDEEHKWGNLGYLSIFFFAFSFLTWLALSFISFSKR